jgi:hypothetical protein
MMKKNLKINNVEDLHLEILRLKAQAKDQEVYLAGQYDALKSKLEKPFNFVNNLISWIPGVDIAKELAGSGAKKNGGDLVSRLFSAGTVALLNRLFLRRAGLIKRVLFSALAQQAGSLMNQDRATSLIKSLASMIRGNGKKKKDDPTKLPENVSYAPDFGIPPDCEAS